MVNKKEKIRRCREHVTILESNETCSFAKHSKNNKIEEMSRGEAEILNWVEMNTVVEQWKNNETGQEELWIGSKKHYKTKKGYHRQITFNPLIQDPNEVIGDNFREIAGLIAEDIKGNVEEKWVFKKIVYQFCPDAICGNNPCSCKKNKKLYGDR